MDLHENVILDLLPGVRSGHASAESRQLVERYLVDHPQLAQLAALMPTPDAALELRALQRTRQELGRASWLKGLAIFATLLPLSFRVDSRGLTFLLADHPGLVVGLAMVATGLWVRYAVQRRQSGLLR
ncbi:MAG: hypothetical protein ACREO3_11435 [Arenimonas sp.]